MIADLFELARGQQTGRLAGDDASITLFKSVGTALEDLAAAELAVFCRPERSAGILPGSLGLRPRDDSLRLLRLDQRAGLLQRLDLGIAYAGFGQHARESAPISGAIGRMSAACGSCASAARPS